MKLSKSTLVMLLIAVLTLAADQVTKTLVTTRMAPNTMWAPIPSLGHIFTITYTTNTGAAFGLFKELGTVFIGIAVVVIAAIVIYQSHVPETAWLIRAALGLQLGGAAGNLMDRLRMGHVIDFIDFHFWPVFNLADSAIVVGVIVLAWTMLREGDAEQHSAPKSPQSTDLNPPA